MPTIRLLELRSHRHHLFPCWLSCLNTTLRRRPRRFVLCHCLVRCVPLGPGRYLCSSIVVVTAVLSTSRRESSGKLLPSQASQSTYLGMQAHQTKLEPPVTLQDFLLLANAEDTLVIWRLCTQQVADSPPFLNRRSAEDSINCYSVACGATL